VSIQTGAAHFAQQYILQKGLKKFGQKGSDAATKELKQLHDRVCFEPISVADMSQSEIRKSMEALMLLTEKRDGTIKGRMVYNGKPTREWLSREDSTELVREDAPHFALRDRTFLRTVLFRAIICHHEALTGAHCPSLSSPFHDNL
jgi:hypothetical protein